ncbi:hypothetical protein HMN09_01011600 [Mycena chlorophos]|uniref:Uncharacterized protein n=1 Tax=Mycena chlorophos TaxID=658473 RepID=A0A8H6SFE6_MYCCL|nr:hypothetical protein HMN09_01011600 [Mycena chlorophos]
MIIDDDSTKSSSLFQSDQPTTQAGPSEPPPPPYTPNSPHSPSSEAPDLESGGDREKRAKTRRRKHKRRRWIVLGSLLLNVLLFFMLFHVVRRSRGLGHGPPGFVRLPWDREHGRPGKGHPHSHNREADDRDHFGQAPKPPHTPNLPMDAFTSIVPTKTEEETVVINEDGGSGSSGTCIVCKEDTTLEPVNEDSGSGSSGTCVIA